MVQNQRRPHVAAPAGAKLLSTNAALCCSTIECQISKCSHFLFLFFFAAQETPEGQNSALNKIRMTRGNVSFCVLYTRQISFSSLQGCEYGTP